MSPDLKDPQSTYRPTHVIGRTLDHGKEQLEPRSRVRQVATVFSDTGWGDIQITVYRSQDVTCRAGCVLTIESDAHEWAGFLPFVECSEGRISFHQAGESESIGLANLLDVASTIVRGNVAEAASKAVALGVGLTLYAESDMPQGSSP